ncbi:hypothetical protein AVEN_212324-1 [Araneus ventricosus]|uniref:Uncharacterized protein n=1 Tax=Araneus ventricosus TaxID=182803 RepID=A0A4Y2F3F8_ARAVE|nr:hypothetical protein AVEN_212324-1 [Araneus ventricosus]
MSGQFRQTNRICLNVPWLARALLDEADAVRIHHRRFSKKKTGSLTHQNQMVLAAFQYFKHTTKTLLNSRVYTMPDLEYGPAPLRYMEQPLYYEKHSEGKWHLSLLLLKLHQTVAFFPLYTQLAASVIVQVGKQSTETCYRISR